MFLDPSENLDNKIIIPFIKNGIIIDTSVIDIIVNGLINSRISKKDSPELDDLLKFFDRLKIKNEWNKFFITPHILTEVCTHLRNTYSKQENYKEIVKEILPLLHEMREEPVEKIKIIGHIDFNKPVIEVGDISIFKVADDYISRVGKIAILSKDDGLSQTYKDNPNVMVMDYTIIMNYLKYN